MTEQSFDRDKVLQSMDRDKVIDKDRCFDKERVKCDKKKSISLTRTAATADRDFGKD